MGRFVPSTARSAMTSSSDSSSISQSGILVMVTRSPAESDWPCESTAGKGKPGGMGWLSLMGSASGRSRCQTEQVLPEEADDQDMHQAEDREAGGVSEGRRPDRHG